VGITGATAMNGYTSHDDVDLCIITKHQYLWTTRFFAVVFAKLLGIHTDKGICLNLFFDVEDLRIPKIKHNSYIAHELLQMKPTIDKNRIYDLLIWSNRWIFDYYPNIQSRITNRVTQNVQNKKNDICYTLHAYVERFFKSIQLPIIKKNKTGFRITNHQLWLFRRDFEKKLKRKGLGR
jgi:hypothetical protein